MGVGLRRFSGPAKAKAKVDSVVLGIGVADDRDVLQAMTPVDFGVYPIAQKTSSTQPDASDGKRLVLIS